MFKDTMLPYICKEKAKKVSPLLAIALLVARLKP
jgi:hypothetical protein